MYNRFDLQDLQNELWVVAPFNKNYHISTYGRVKIFCKDLKRSKTYPRIAKPSLNKFGYYWYGLIDENKIKKTWFAHRLVATCFIENSENKSQVNHKNGVKTDNRIDNLEWATPLENTQHSNYIGLVDIKGEKNCEAKLSKEQVIEILQSKVSSKKICTKYNISSSSVRKIRNGRGWNHITGLPKKRRYGIDKLHN